MSLQGACNVCNAVAEATCHHCDEWVCARHCQYFDTDGLPLSYCAECLDDYLEAHGQDVDRESVCTDIMEVAANLPTFKEVIVDMIDKMDSIEHNQELSDIFEILLNYSPNSKLPYIKQLVERAGAEPEKQRG